MKTILFLLSFMFMSCVTANTESRDLSAVNTAEGENITLAHALLYRNTKPNKPNNIFQDIQQQRREKIKLKRPCSEICDRCDLSCLRKCGRYNAMSEQNLKVASIEDQNYFNLLKESQSEDRQGDFFDYLSTEDNNNKDKTPLMLADDYDTCVKGCICEGGSSSECHRVCEE